MLGDLDKGGLTLSLRQAPVNNNITPVFRLHL
jgi:hypothetical protein